MSEQTTTRDPGHDEGEETVQHAAVPESAEPTPTAPSGGKRPMRRATRIRLVVIGGLVLLIALAFLAYYVIDTRNYVTTDNAQVDGNQISINAPATGTLIDWDATQERGSPATSRSVGSPSRVGTPSRSWSSGHPPTAR